MEITLHYSNATKTNSNCELLQKSQEYDSRCSNDVYKKKAFFMSRN